MTDFHAVLRERIEALDAPSLRAQFLDQDESLVIEEFLPQPVLKALLGYLPLLAPRVHRNYLPGHKKGGSVSRFELDAHAPAFARLYGDPALNDFFRTLTGSALLACPPQDPHTYALYYYTEAGDHIGWHYDTSYYRGLRYTVLLGLVDESSCRLECQLRREDPKRPTKTFDVNLKPGMLMIFNGERLYHRVTPLGEGERRIALTLEYLTNTHMSAIGRFVSNMKDAVAYFGLRQVFSRRT